MSEHCFCCDKIISFDKRRFKFNKIELIDWTWFVNRSNRKCIEGLHTNYSNVNFISLINCCNMAIDIKVSFNFFFFFLLIMLSDRCRFNVASHCYSIWSLNAAHRLALDYHLLGHHRRPTPQLVYSAFGTSSIDSLNPLVIASNHGHLSSVKNVWERLIFLFVWNI